MTTDEPLHRALSLPVSDAEVWQEGDVYVSHWPTLDVYSQGDTEQEAEANLAEAIRLFVESCSERGTLEAVIGAQGL